MRKFILILVFAISAFASSQGFGASNLQYTFNFSNSECEKVDYESKKMIYKLVQNSEWIIDEMVDIQNGIVTTIIAEDNYKRPRTGFYASTIESCLWIKKNEHRFNKK